MRYSLQKMLAGFLVLAFCLLPVLGLAEGSMLSEQMGKALQAGQQIEIAVHLEVSDALLMMLLPEEALADAQNLLQSTAIRLRYAKGEGDQWMGGFSLSMLDTEILSGVAETADGGVAVETNLLPGKTLLVPLEMAAGLLPSAGDDSALDDGLAAQLESYLTAIAEWAEDEQVIVTTNEIGTSAPPTRDPAVSATHIRVSGEQLQSLLLLLVDRFGGDAVLPMVLGASGLDATDAEGLQAMVSALAPTGAEFTANVYLGETGKIVSAGGEMPAMFETWTAQGNFQYEATHREAPGMLENAFELSLAVQPSEEEAVQRVDIANASTREADETLEKTHGEFSLAYAQGEEPEEGGASSMAIGLITDSETTLIGENDFQTETEITLTLGMPLCVVRIESLSSEREAVLTPDNELIDVAALSAEENQALSDELSMGLMMTLFTVMSVLPPTLSTALGLSN